MITVIIPVRNGEDFIADAIESVLNQTCQNVHTLVSDNGSSDNTISIVSKYLDNSRIELVRQTESLDMFGHFNKCLSLITTKYYMMLHHDDCLREPEALQKAYDILEKNQFISVVYSDMAYIDKIGNLINYRLFNRAGIIESDKVAKGSILSIRNLFGVPLLIRASTVKHMKYDNTLIYASDLDFSIMISRNASFYHINEPLISYRIHGKNATISLFKLAKREMLKIADKNLIKIGQIEKIKMSINAFFVAIQKYLFFLYLEKIRKY